MINRHEHDVLLIGGGIAGLTFALMLADRRPITLLESSMAPSGASPWAQGGIAAVLSAEDSLDSHVQDTLTAGDGLCDEAAVRFTVEQGPAAIQWLISLGVPFSPDEAAAATFPFHLTQEGGHGRRRVIHAADATGKAVIDVLSWHAHRHPRIRLIEGQNAFALLKDEAGHCRGALCLGMNGQVTQHVASETVIATGGASGLYPHATSPSPGLGIGMSMAAEIGAKLANLEFQQFHPTCLHDPQGRPFLISEAVRGEGGLLRTPLGYRFMPDYDPRAELAPRDIVARAIDAQMKQYGFDHVLLDVTHLPAAKITAHFPTIHAHCLTRGLDMTRHPIPVVPAAHYSCGGVVTALDASTNIPQLSAIGEVASTGLHGANRLASNSLLECVVFGRSAAARLASTHFRPEAKVLMPALGVRHGPSEPEMRAMLKTIRQTMAARAGIVRDDAGLQEARRILQAQRERLDVLWNEHRPSPALVQTRHTARLACLVVDAALARRHSCGLHYNVDCPRRDGKASFPSEQGHFIAGP